MRLSAADLRDLEQVAEGLADKIAKYKKSLDDDRNLGRGVCGIIDRAQLEGTKLKRELILMQLDLHRPVVKKLKAKAAKA